jgi:MYXO-CTERM domain-containing protein
MSLVLGLALAFAASAGPALAGAAAVPEIDPGSANAALALLAGGMLILRSRRRRT